MQTTSVYKGARYELRELGKAKHSQIYTFLVERFGNAPMAKGEHGWTDWIEWAHSILTLTYHVKYITISITLKLIEVVNGLVYTTHDHNTNVWFL